MDNLLEKLAKWIKVIEKAIIGTIIIEGILVIIIGVASNKIGSTFDLWAIALIISSLAYLFLSVINALYQIKFPGSIIEELKSKRELEVKNKLLIRQTAINQLINSSIRGLNTQTCSIDSYPTSEHLCDKQLETRLAELLNPIVEYTDVILDTTTDKEFTIGIYLEFYNRFPDDYSKINLTQGSNNNHYIEEDELIEDKGILILKDELALDYLVPKDLLELDKINGASYEIQSSIRRSHNNTQFDKHEFYDKDQLYTIICSDILEVCSDNYANGVLFIITKNQIEVSEDVPDILKIFNRLTTNYTTKYNACIKERIINKKLKEQSDNILSTLESI